MKTRTTVRAKTTAVASDEDSRIGCPQCAGRLHRTSLDSLREQPSQGEWKRDFLEHTHTLPAGRYRCVECVVEWWQYPVSAAS